MRPLLSIGALLLLALGAVEGIAYWWMHPAPAGLGAPVLVYRPGSRGHRTVAGGQGADVRDQEESKVSVPSASHKQLSTSSTTSSLSTFNPQLSTSSITPLPDVVAKAIPSLRCSTGTAARIDSEDGVTIHVAFFEWDLSDSANVLEAFKHLPEECMGSIGMKLISQPPPRSYQVGNETLWFDHTIFRDPGGNTVHAFKGTWVSGASSLIGDGFRGGVEQWTQIRWKAGLSRFHPAYARVVQGAVRGIRDPDLAWQAFEEAMLKDLRMENR